MTFVSDTFTDTDGTHIPDHTGETGAGWTKHPASNVTSSFEADIQSNRAAGTQDNNTGLYYASGVPASAEYDVEADYFVDGSGTFVSHGICGRLDTSANTMYLVRYNGTQWDLFKAEAGSFTSLGSWAQTLNTNDTGTVKLEIRDATKKVYIDGVERISSNNNDVTGAGRAGIRQANSKLHFDNFTAADAGAAPAATGSVVDYVAPTLDGPAVTLGDGSSVRRYIRIPAGAYATPIWVRPDGVNARTQRYDALPAQIHLVAGQIEVLSSAPV